MTDDPLEQVRDQHRYEVENTYTDDEEDQKVTAINQYLKKNDMFHENMLRIYDDATRNGDPVSTVKLYKRTVELNNVLVNILDDSEQDELAEKLEKEMQEMIERVPPDSLDRHVSRSERLGWPVSKIEKVVSEHGTAMRSYCFWLLSGTQITSETGGMV